MFEPVVIPPAVLGPFGSPVVVVGVLIVLLLILVVGRILIGVAWRLEIIALVVA